jgi:hypothetical protein
VAWRHQETHEATGGGTGARGRGYRRGRGSFKGTVEQTIKEGAIREEGSGLVEVDMSGEDEHDGASEVAGVGDAVARRGVQRAQAEVQVVERLHLEPEEPARHLGD